MIAEPMECMGNPVSYGAPLWVSVSIEAMTMKLYVGRFTFKTRSAELAELFAPAGRVESASANDRETRRSRRFGFGETASNQEGDRALTKDKQVYAVGDRVEQMCVTCGEEHGHIVASVTKKGRITRVSCPICGSRVPYKSGLVHKGGVARPRTLRLGAPYDRSRTYQRGQTMMHPTHGEGEVNFNEAKPSEDLLGFVRNRDRNRSNFVEVEIMGKQGEYSQERAILVGTVDELKDATLMEDKDTRAQVQSFFTGIRESRKRTRKLQTEINRLKKKTQAIIDKLA
jgi:DNA-directed RNA polymerase subunit RPC12/RpoP